MLGLVSALSLASAAEVIAQPAGQKGEPAAVPQQTPWTGFYMGLNLGGSFADGEIDLNGAGLTVLDPSKDENDFIAGVHLGYNWRHTFWPFVAGVEADLGFASELNYLFSLRGRAGFVSDRSFIYATVGFAVADFTDNDFTIDDTTAAQALTVSGNSDAELGYVLGGGAEFDLGRNWSLGLEGLYYMFDESTARGTFTPATGDPIAFEAEEDLDFWTIRGRLTYYFKKREDLAPLPPSDPLK